MRQAASIARPAVVLLAAFTVLTGLLYPLAVTGLAQAIFPYQANGSLICTSGALGTAGTAGSALIGQPFDDPGYFWGRPSATVPYPYNAGASSGSNLGPSNPALVEAVQTRVAALRDAAPSNTQPAPVDLVTASASGLDPHISIAAALYQVPRIARVRGLDEDTVRQLVAQQTEDRQFGILGEPRVNVLKLNLALDGVE
jgi:K+-transporting ATPase ATPase C chain